jgi:hypothetical protein
MYLERAIGAVQRASDRRLTASIVVIVAGHRKFDVGIPADTRILDLVKGHRSDVRSHDGETLNYESERQDDTTHHVRHSTLAAR